MDNVEASCRKDCKDIKDNKSLYLGISGYGGDIERLRKGLKNFYV